MYKIIGGDQKEYGPISAEQIRQWIIQGRLNAQTSAQAEGGDWKPLAEFPEFAAAFGSTTPPAFPSAPSPSSPLPGAMPGAAPPPKTNGLAIASLVLGIVGFFTCGVAAVVGLVLGIIAINQVKKSNGAQTGLGLAIAGTIVSACFILMLPVGAAMFLPAIAKARQKALTVECMNNLRQLSFAARTYADAHSGRYPDADTWCDTLKESAHLEDKTFKCPAAINSSERCNYAYNSHLSGVDEKNVDPYTVLFFETAGGWNVSGDSSLMLHQSRHGRVFLVAFADGHVEAVTAERLSGLRWNP